MSENNETSITLKNEHGEYTIRMPITEVSVAQIFDDFFIPILLAAGYSKEAIDSYIENEI